MAQVELDRPAPIDPNGQIFFIHIPKCAGTSLGERLSKQYDQNLVILSSENAIGKLSRVPKKRFASARLMSGHFPEVVRQTYMPQSQAITGLRNPIKRLRSLIAHGARGVRFRGWMAPFYEDYDVSFLQTKEAQYAFMMNTSQLTYLMPTSLAGRPISPDFVTDQDVKDAVETLDKCSCVYTDDSFDQFSGSLGGLFCDPPAEKTQRLNTAPNKLSWLDAIDLDELAAHLCPWDLELYQEAERRAAETLATLGDSTKPEAYAAWWKEKPQLERVAVDFGAPYKSHGLGVRRSIPYGFTHVVNSRQMVQLVANAAYVDIRRPENPSKMTIWFAGAHRYSNPILTCDGVELESSSTQIFPRVTRHSAKLPRAKDSAPPYIRLGFKFDERLKISEGGHVLSMAIS